MRCCECILPVDKIAVDVPAYSVAFAIFGTSRYCVSCCGTWPSTMTIRKVIFI